MRLIEQTRELLNECDASIKRFYCMRELDASPDFFNDVKPHADHIHSILVEWQQLTKQWIKENQPKYIHAQQVDNAVDAVDQFVVQSFYKKTSKKRFEQSVLAVHFTLTTLLRNLEEGESDVQ
ncbi:YppE family protein [Ureibacillus sp. NPDC094379]